MEALECCRAWGKLVSKAVACSFTCTWGFYKASLEATEEHTGTHVIKVWHMCGCLLSLCFIQLSEESSQMWLKCFGPHKDIIHSSDPSKSGR